MILYTVKSAPARRRRQRGSMSNGGAAMEKLKKTLFSQNGMRIINTLLFLAIVLRAPIVTMCAYALWIAYLAFCIRHSDSKGMRISYGVMIAFAVVILMLNLLYYTGLVGR